MAADKVLLSESECARLAGVSVNTIRQYRSLGLLGAETVNGQTLVNSSDLREVFGVEEEAGAEQQKIPQAQRANASFQPLMLVAGHGELRSSAPQRPQRGPSKPQRSAAAAKLRRKNQSLNARCRALEARLKLVLEERNWLRTRVERLEVRSEREQLLLLSQQKQAQTLLEQQSPKRSFWSLALPWFSGTDSK